jgi:hypothetical protein
MATSTFNRKALLLATVLACGVRAAVAGDYPLFPNTELGTTYYWKTYRVDERGKRSYQGVYTNTVAGTAWVDGHAYVVVRRRNTLNQPVSDIEYRQDDELCGTLDGEDARSLVIKWKGVPSVGQTWSRGSVQTVIRKREDVEANGVVYRDCLVVDRLDDGRMTSRCYFDQEQGWVKVVAYQQGKITGVGYRTSKEAAYTAD